MDRRRRGNKDQAVEPQFIKGVLGGHKVSEVDRIEGAAQDSDACHEAKYAASALGCQVLSAAGGKGVSEVEMDPAEKRSRRVSVAPAVLAIAVLVAIDLAVVVLGRVPMSATAAGGLSAAAPTDITFVGDDAEPAGKDAPPNPFGIGAGGVDRKDAVPGYVELSSGVKVPGKIYTTRAKRLKIYNLRREMYEYVPVPALMRIEAAVEWERMEREWRFKEAGNPEKIYSGREYPARKVAYTLTLRNGHTIYGHILGQPLYVEDGGAAVRHILHDRGKGRMGETLADLVYVRRVEFGPEAYEAAVREREAKASPAAATASD